MSFIKSFEVFGERVDILVDSETSGGASTTLIQHVAPGGGPPPHTHTREDETFTALEGDFEIFSEGEWSPLARRDSLCKKRKRTHLSQFRHIARSSPRLHHPWWL